MGPQQFWPVFSRFVLLEAVNVLKDGLISIFVWFSCVCDEHPVRKPSVISGGNFFVSSSVHLFYSSLHHCFFLIVAHICGPVCPVFVCFKCFVIFFYPS